MKVTKYVFSINLVKNNYSTYTTNIGIIIASCLLFTQIKINNVVYNIRDLNTF